MTTRVIAAASAVLVLAMPVSRLSAQDGTSTTAPAAPPKTMMASCDHQTTAAALQVIEKLVADTTGATDIAALQGALNHIGAQVTTMREASKKCADMMEAMKMKMKPTPPAEAPAKPHH